MADKKKKRIIKPVESVRERAAKSDAAKPRRIKRAVKKTETPTEAASKTRREINLPLPDNRVGRILGKRVRLLPKFFHEAWAEVKQVSWPSNRETLKLSLAVFIFAIVFGGLIYIVDYGLERLFREILIG